MIVSMQPELKVISKNDAKGTMTFFWNKQRVFVALIAEVWSYSLSKNKIHPMKIVCKTKNGESREALLKKYFITASLIALLKRVGEETAKAAAYRVKTAAHAKVRI